MKKCFLHSILALLVCLMAAQGVYAGQYYKPVYNRLGVWTDLGADAWLMSKSEIKSSIGGGLGLGFVYEMQRENFLLNIGVGVNALYNPVKMAGGQYVLYDQSDLDPLYGGGEKVDYYYNLTERQDKYLGLNIQVPILFGFTKDRFFLLGGVKLGYMLNLQTWCDATVETKGYNATIGWMQNMPMYQYYPSRQKTATMRCTMKPDVALSLEMGGYVGEVIKGTGYNRFRKPKHLRVSAFVDYGLIGINQRSLIDPLIVPQKYVTPAEYDMVDAMQMKDAISSRAAGVVNNLFVGIKFTALFDLPETPPCVLCKSDLKFVPRLKQTGRRPKSDEQSNKNRR